MHVRVLHCPVADCDWVSPLYSTDTEDGTYRQSYDRHYRMAHTPEPRLQVYEQVNDEEWVEVLYR